MQIYMQCDKGEIEVFLCPEEETLAVKIGRLDDGPSLSSVRPRAELSPALRVLAAVASRAGATGRAAVAGRAQAGPSVAKPHNL